MKDEELERLLGGYATNTLSETERQALFAAALEDQNLFDALQDEEALRDLLGDPESREQISQALKQPAQPQKPERHWWRGPWVLVFTGSAAAACVLIIILVHRPSSERSVLQTQLAAATYPEAVPPPESAKESRVPRALEMRVQKPAPAAQPSAAVPKSRRSAPPGTPRAVIEQKNVEQKTAEQKTSPDVPVSTAVATENVPVIRDAEPAPAPSPPAVAVTSTGASPGVAGGAPAPHPSASAALNRFSAARKSSLFSGLQLSVVRGDHTLGAADSLQTGDTVRFRAKAPVDGVLQIFTLEADATRKPMLPPLTMRAGQEYLVPDSPIAVSQPQTLLVVFVSAQGSQQSTRLELQPGKPPIVR